MFREIELLFVDDGAMLENDAIWNKNISDFSRQLHTLCLSAQRHEKDIGFVFRLAIGTIRNRRKGMKQRAEGGSEFKLLSKYDKKFATKLTLAVWWIERAG